MQNAKSILEISIKLIEVYFKENYLLIRNNGSKYKNKTKLFKTLQ